jgi:DNA-binding transcriptional LysR family regulator
MDLRGVNLNLLLALDVLLEVRGVGLAAKRLGITQSAMSHSLRQLREVFDDPLLVRVGHRMIPTPRAEALAPSLRDALRTIEGVVESPEAFEPAQASRTFTIALLDGVTAAFGPSILRRMRKEAPKATLQIVQPGNDLAERMATGRVDAASLPPFDVPAGLETTPLRGAEFVVLCREDHPDIGDSIDLDTFCRLPHAVMSLGKGGPSFVDDALAAMGRERFVALYCPYYLAIPAMVAETDLIALIVKEAAEQFAKGWGVRHVPEPLGFGYMPPSLLAWHVRYDAAPESRWFRDLVLRAVEEDFPVS